MPFNLIVPSANRRRKSEGCIPPRSQVNREVTPKHSVEQHVDNNLLDVLWKNYDFVSTLADIENHKDGNRRPSRQFFLPKNENSFDSLNSTISSGGAGALHSSFLKLPTLSEECSRFLWARNHVKRFFSDIAEAFTVPKEAFVETNGDSSKLSAVALRRDLKRCCAALHPLLEIGAALQDIVLWKNPVTSLLLSLVFFYSIVRGWTASLVLLLLLLQLTINHFYTCHQVNLGLCFLPRRAVPTPHFDVSGAQIIFDIAKTVQGLLRMAADIFEKLHNLLMWRDAQVTFVFYCLVMYWLLLSLIFSTGTCLGMCAFTLGIRIFITTYLFDRFPKLRRRLDTYGYFYRNLPIGKEDKDKDSQEKNSDHAEEPQPRSLSPASRNKFYANPKISTTSIPPLLISKEKDQSSRSLDSQGLFKKREQYGSFNSLYGSQSQLSQVSSDEGATEEIDLLMDTVVAFRHCILHERNRPFPKNIISGTLYLTDTSLAFRPKNNSSTNVIPPMTLFHDIVSVKKVTTLRTVGLIAGTRKAVEIRLVNRRRSVQFLGLAERDEFVEKMREMCIKQSASTHFVIDDNEEAE